MANIQQAVNSILSSAQAGAFLLSQTPAYKKQAEITSLKQEGKVLAQEDKALESNIEEGKDLVSSYERSQELDKDLYQHNLALYHKTGEQKYFDEALKYTPSKRSAQDELIAEEKDATKLTALKKAKATAEATRAAEASYTTRGLTLEGMLTVLNDRKDVLSAKQRGQLSTIAHTLSKKGELK